MTAESEEKRPGVAEKEDSRREIGDRFSMIY